MTISVPAQIASHFPSDAEIKRILAQRIDEQRQSLGIVVGTFGPEGRRVVSHGRFGAFYARPVDGDTVFEIGSITKTFTTLLLAEMVGRGEVKLDDPVAKYLPETVTVPERGDRQITLTDLATHTSGLPCLPDNFEPTDLENPYADYSVEQIYAFLSGYTLPRDIGSQYEYSNLAMGLLGHALAQCAGMDYGMLLHERILAPLDMSSTADTVYPDMKNRLANGHDHTLAPVAGWDLPTLAGAGALLSSVNDQLNYLEMLLGARPSPLSTALATTLATRRPMDDGNETGLAWVISGAGDDELIWHNGGTGGYRSFLGFMPAKGIGIVALSNTATEVGVDDIATHLLNQDVKLAEPPKVRVAVAVDPDIYAGYVGNYPLAPEFALTITREGDYLFAQATGQPKAQIFPESETDFFLTAVNAQISFDVDESGQATGLTLHQNGAEIPGQRVAG